MQISAPTEARVLVVADWTIDPHEVVAACAQRRDGAVFVLTVAAWLHGLDWAAGHAHGGASGDRPLRPARLGGVAGRRPLRRGRASGRLT